MSEVNYVRAMNWQLRREMPPKEYRRILKELGMSRAAAGRFLGLTARQSYRYGNGDSEIPVAVVLLLRAMHKFRIRPVVPKWHEDQN